MVISWVKLSVSRSKLVISRSRVTFGPVETLAELTWSLVGYQLFKAGWPLWTSSKSSTISSYSAYSLRGLIVNDHLKDQPEHVLLLCSKTLRPAQTGLSSRDTDSLCVLKLTQPSQKARLPRDVETSVGFGLAWQCTLCVTLDSSWRIRHLADRAGLYKVF